jgi:TolA-binding protein
MKRKLTIKRIIASSVFLVTVLSGICFASDLTLLEDKLKACPADLYNVLEELKAVYFRDNNFADFLKTLKENQPCVKSIQYDYYNALAKYSELKKLEADQNWQAYFEIKDSYGEGIDKSLKEALAYYSKNSVDKIGLETKYLSWFIEKENSGTAEGKLLDNLMSDIKNYTGADIKIIKDIADRFAKEGLNPQAQNLYAIYAKKLLSVEKDPQVLKTEADLAFEALNLTLASVLYDARLELLLSGSNPKEYCQELIVLINKFSDNGFSPAKDAFYAEKLFKQLNQTCPELFDAGLTYSRAYNLERLKEYKDAVSAYQKFIDVYPDDPRISEARFHAGIINLYVLNNPDEALRYLAPLSVGKDTLAVSANYYLGLYYQWNKEIDSANKYYALAKSLLESEGSLKNDLLLRLIGERLVEVNENKAIEDNLRLFLEAAFSSQAVADNLELNAAPAKSFVDQEQKLTLNYFAQAIGCFQPEVKFFWAGETGNNNINNDTQSFDASFHFPGSKVIFVTFQSAGSVSGKQLQIIDIYNVAP